MIQMSPSETSMKRCKGCQRLIPLSEFYQHGAMKDGYLNFCKDCVRLRISAYRLRNVEQARAKESERYYRKRDDEEFKRGRLKYMRGWRTPQKVKAHNDVRRRLKRPDACSMCGKKCKVEGHHPNYEKPLEIVWVCAMCHHQIHKKICLQVTQLRTDEF